MTTPLLPRLLARRVCRASCAVLSIAFAGCVGVPLKHRTGELYVILKQDLPPNMTAPTPIHTLEPKIPYWLASAGIDAHAMVDCLVDERGAVHNVNAGETSDGEFAAASAAALRGWRFSPGTLNGQPIPLRVRIPFLFVPNFE